MSLSFAVSVIAYHVACSVALLTSVRRIAWLGYLNFALLQWFGVRLVRHVETIPAADVAEGSVGVGLGPTIGFSILRWVWPLTGWWTDFRFVGRRRDYLYVWRRR